jgi:hypothetical protein
LKILGSIWIRAIRISASVPFYSSSFFGGFTLGIGGQSPEAGKAVQLWSLDVGLVTRICSGVTIFSRTKVAIPIAGRLSL